MSAARSIAELGGEGEAAVGAEPGRFLGPATVTVAAAGELEARLPDGQLVRPRMAIAFPFEPAVGDDLLLIGQEGRYFVIGVVASSGATHLRFRGNVELRAVDGALELAGAQGVEIRGPQVTIKTRKLDVYAERASELFGSALTRVKELLSVHAGSAETTVDGAWTHRSKQAVVSSEEAVTINGKEVHLG